MKKQAGLWIDHRKSVIILITDAGEKTKRILSNVDKHVRFSGGADAVSEEDIQDNKFSGQLDKYYAEVVACLDDAESIFIFGPGEAKGELKKRLESKGFGAGVVAIQAADKMTDRQIVAQVRRRFPK